MFVIHILGIQIKIIYGKLFWLNIIMKSFVNLG